MRTGFSSGCNGHTDLVRWITDYLTGRQFIRMKNTSDTSEQHHRVLFSPPSCSPYKPLWALYKQKYSDMVIDGCIRDGRQKEYRSLVEDFVMMWSKLVAAELHQVHSSRWWPSEGKKHTLTSVYKVGLMWRYSEPIKTLDYSWKTDRSGQQTQMPSNPGCTCLASLWESGAPLWCAGQAAPGRRTTGKRQWDSNWANFKTPEALHTTQHLCLKFRH